MSREGVNNPQLTTNSQGGGGGEGRRLPHYQFRIKSGILADLIGLFSPVL